MMRAKLYTQSGGSKMNKMNTLPASWNHNERNLYAKQDNKMVIVGKINMRTKEVIITADTKYTRSGYTKKSMKWKWIPKKIYR